MCPLFHPEADEEIHHVHKDNKAQSEDTILDYEQRLMDTGGVLEGMRIEMNSVITNEKDSMKRTERLCFSNV